MSVLHVSKEETLFGGEVPTAKIKAFASVPFRETILAHPFEAFGLVLEAHA